MANVKNFTSSISELELLPTVEGGSSGNAKFTSFHNDRRNNVDRRHMPDRRQDIRFQDDRRSRVDRRKAGDHWGTAF